MGLSERGRTKKEVSVTYLKVSYWPNGLRITAQNLGQDSRRPDRDSRTIPPGCTSVLQ
jgi:hypothetical protein